jgi:hypothetical protein
MHTAIIEIMVSFYKRLLPALYNRSTNYSK